MCPVLGAKSQQTSIFQQHKTLMMQNYVEPMPKVVCQSHRVFLRLMHKQSILLPDQMKVQCD